MAAALGCGGEGFTAAASSALWMQCRPRPSQSFLCGSSALGRNSCRFPRSVGPPLDNSSNKRNVDVRVAADYSDSKPDSFKRRGKWGYHPLEELSKVEKDEIDQAGDGKLSDAEVARTISEVNWSAVIFSSVVSNEDAVFGTEVQYLIDDHGDFYFEVEDDNEFLRNLSSEQIYTVLIGFGNVDGLQFSELVETEAVLEAMEGDDSDDDELLEIDAEDIEILWEAVENAEDSEDDSTPEESFGSLGGWGGYQTLENVHPMEFAFKVSEAASADHASELGKPPRRLTITGVARPVTEEEEPYVQGIWYDRFLTAEDESEDDEEEEVHDMDDEGHRQDGDDVVDQQSAKSTEQDGARFQNDRASRSKAVPEGARNGIVLGKSLNGTAKLSSARDYGKRSTDPLVLSEKYTVKDSTELSPNDGSVIELGSSTASSAESLSARKDAHREGQEGQEGAIVSWEIPVSKDKNTQLGSRFDSAEVVGENVEVEFSSEVVLPPGTRIEGDAIVGEWSEQTKSSDVGASFYKLEIISITLDCGAGEQVDIEVRDFSFAEPDVLAHFASAIMERVNSGGQKTEIALKALCHRVKGLDADEVTLVGIDCLGVDLKVQCGIEVQNIRVAFSRRATCEDSAEKLLDQLLNPRLGHRRPKKMGPQWNS